MARTDAVSVAVPLRRAQPRPQPMLSAFDGDTRGHTLLRMDAAAPHDVQPARTRGMACNVHQRQRQRRRCSARRRSQRAAWLACACARQLLVVRCKNGWPESHPRRGRREAQLPSHRVRSAWAAADTRQPDKPRAHAARNRSLLACCFAQAFGSHHADVGGVSPVPVQMWQRRAQPRCRCGSSEPSPGADVAAVNSVSVGFARWSAICPFALPCALVAVGVGSQCAAKAPVLVCVVCCAGSVHRCGRAALDRRCRFIVLRNSTLRAVLPPCLELVPSCMPPPSI